MTFTDDDFGFTHARTSDRQTSHDAAAKVGKRESQGPTAKNQCGRILMKMHARDTWTVDEVTSATGFDAHQRFTDLERGKYIEDTGCTRMSIKQCAQTVYRLTPAGREWAMQHIGDIT